MGDADSSHGNLRNKAIMVTITAVFIVGMAVIAGTISSTVPTLPLIVMDVMGLFILILVAVIGWGLQGGFPRA